MLVSTLIEMFRYINIFWEINSRSGLGIITHGYEQCSSTYSCFCSDKSLGENIAWLGDVTVAKMHDHYKSDVDMFMPGPGRVCLEPVGSGQCTDRRYNTPDILSEARNVRIATQRKFS